jgi:D-3-phosphoglycerate dehydrogenase
MPTTVDSGDHGVFKPLVAFLDPLPHEVRAIVAAEAPESVQVRMATTHDPAEKAALAPDAEFFVGGVTPLPGSLIDAAPRLRLIHKWGIGVDKIDLEAARRRGIPVAITAGGNAVPVAEHTLLLMLAVLRRLPHRQEQLRAGRWNQARADARVESFQLRGKLVGIVGMGNVGREVARRVRAFDAAVRYYDVRRLSPAEEQALGTTYAELDDLLPASDVVSLHVPYVNSTRRLLSRERIDRLKPSAIVINAARGEVVDEAALAEALREGRIAGAGLDVFSPEPPPPDHPLVASRLPNLVLTPHVAGSTFDNVANVARHIFGNVERVLRGEPIAPADLVTCLSNERTS